MWLTLKNLFFSLCLLFPPVSSITFHLYWAYLICPFKYDILKPVSCQVVNACQNVKGFSFPFSSFFVTDDDYFVIVVTIKMDVNCDSTSFLESHYLLQFFIFPISKTLLFCFLWIFYFSSSKVNQKNLTTVIFTSMASLVSTSCSHICPDSFCITVNIFTMTFWSYCLSLWILLLLQCVTCNFITPVNDQRCWQLSPLSVLHVLLFFHTIIYAQNMLNCSIKPLASQNLLLLAGS